MTTRRKLLAARQRQEEERSVTRAAEKAAKPVEKKMRLKVVEPVLKAKDEKSWRFNEGMDLDQALLILATCKLPTENADALVRDFDDRNMIIFESDVRAWAEGRR